MASMEAGARRSGVAFMDGADADDFGDSPSMEVQGGRGWGVIRGGFHGQPMVGVDNKRDGVDACRSGRERAPKRGWRRERRGGRAQIRVGESGDGGERGEWGRERRGGCVRRERRGDRDWR
jgi:hypothetical protein